MIKNKKCQFLFVCAIISTGCNSEGFYIDKTYVVVDSDVVLWENLDCVLYELPIVLKRDNMMEFSIHIQNEPINKTKNKITFGAYQFNHIELWNNNKDIFKTALLHEIIEHHVPNVVVNNYNTEHNQFWKDLKIKTTNELKNRCAQYN